MNTLIKYSNKLVFAIALCAMVISGCSCSAPKPQPDPLTGFHMADLRDLHLNKVITDDYKGYIQTLSPEERKYLGTIFFYENGAGQHAVKIEIGLDGTWWEHLLIYDKDNQRTKTMKYSNGGYRS